MRKGLFLLLSVLLLVGQAVAQNRTLSGKVTSSDDGQPVIGATVIVKGTNSGTVTDVNGVYTLQLPQGATALVVKFVGMKDQEAKISGADKLNVVLYPDVTKLTETVVTANAIRRDKSSLGYSAPTVKAEELTRGQSTSALNALSGKVAGVNITSTAGAPGSSSRIVLRGGSSITGNNQALIVVDGVPIDNTSIIGGGNTVVGGVTGNNPSSLSSVDFGNRGNDINPDDIESMTVLKGPAAAALYGSRASNGAVIITTKSGKKKDNKKNEVAFSSTVTFSNVLKLPEFQNEYGQGSGMQHDPKENTSWGPKFDGVETPWGQEINGKRQTKPYSAIKDNVKDFFETGRMINNNISLSGAGEKTTYYLSFNSLNSDGVLPDNYDKFNKYGIRFNGSAQLSNKFYTSIGVNYNKINSNVYQGGQGNGSVYNAVLQTPRDINITGLSDLSNPYNSYGSYIDKNGNKINGVYGYYGAYTVNPYYILRDYRNQNDVDRVTGNFTIGYKPLEWLDVVERVGADVYADRRRIKTPKFTVVPIDNTSGEYSANANARSQVGMYGEYNYNLSEITHDLMVTAKKKLATDFNGSIMVGHNVRQRTFTRLEASTNTAGGLVVPGWYNLDNSNGPLNSYDEYGQRRLVGLYGEIDLDYKSMLYLSVTARNDWSSTLPQKNNSFFYPSVSGSFVFSELLKGKAIENILNYGKLRASWAQVGNDSDPYLLNTYWNKTNISTGFGSTIFPFNGIPGFSYGNKIGNPNLKPEITTSYEVGAELAFLDNRLSVDFTYYRNRSRDLIVPIAIPESSGFMSKVMNIGEVENRGIELALRGTPIRTASGFVWELYGTYTRNRNEVLDDGGGPITIGGFSGMSIVAKKGLPYGTFFAPDLVRDPQGRVVVGTNGMPLVTTEGVYFGSYNPKYQASLGTNLSYKGFSFGVLFDTKQGGQFYSRTKSIMDFAGIAPETIVGGREDHIWEGSVYQNENGDYVPNDKYKFTPEKYWTSSKALPAGQHIVDASYIKLREMSLTYRLPRHLLGRTPFGDASVGVFGNNLFIWTPGSNKYADPEINSGGAGNEQGFDFTAQPSLRNYGFNLKVTF